MKYNLKQCWEDSSDRIVWYTIIIIGSDESGIRAHYEVGMAQNVTTRSNVGLFLHPENVLLERCDNE